MIPEEELALMPLVASGDHEASVLLRDGLLMRAQSASAQSLRSDLVSKAEVFGRIAAERGDAGDKVTLAALLLLQSSNCREGGFAEDALHYAREADAVFGAIMQAENSDGRAMLLSVVSGLADKGDELAAIKLQELVELMPAKLISETAKAIRKLEIAGS